MIEIYAPDGVVGKAPATWVFADLDKMTFDQREVPKSLEYGEGAQGNG